MESKWEKIINNLSSDPRDLHTLPLDSREPTWFYAFTDGKNVYVELARNNTNSGLSGRRTLTFSEFKKIYPIYVRRYKGEDVGSEGSKVSYNQSYWYPVIKFCLNQ